MDFNLLPLIAVLALLAQGGYTLHIIGAVRARNAASVAAAALVGTASIVLLAFVFGHVLRWTGEDLSTGVVTGPGVLFATPGAFLSILPLALLPLALAVGAGAERATGRSTVLIAAVSAGFLLPSATEVGWYVMSELDRRRADGTYGSAATLSAVTQVWPVIVAYLVAAGAALAFARAIGPRLNKYNRDGSANTIPAHNLPVMIAGGLLLAIGIPMIAAARAGEPSARLLNAFLAAAAAVLAGVALDWKRHGRVDGVGPWEAAVAGLVAGSLSAPSQPLMSIVLGVALGVIVGVASRKLDLKLRIDDPSGLALPHLLGGLAGSLGATLGAALDGPTRFGEIFLLATIGLSAAACLALAGIACATIVAFIARKLGWLRVDPANEVEGLDLTQHDINAYPDFQQTLIKSYHLRQ